MRGWSGMFVFFSLWILVSSAGPAWAKLRSITLGFDQEWVPSRDQSVANKANKRKSKNPAIVQELAILRQAQINQQHSRCATLAKKLARTAKGFQSWLIVTELSCRLESLKSESKDLASLHTALKSVDDHPQWILFGPQAESLKSVYTEGWLFLFEKQIKEERRLAWQSLDQILLMKKWLSLEQLARVYRAAGELAFLEQNLSLAVDMLSRSLNEKESSDVRRKMESIRNSVLGKKEDKVSEEPSKVVNAVYGEAQSIVDRMQNTIQAGDLLSALEDGVRLLNKMSGSSAAKWAADRILEIYLSLGAKTEGNYPILRQRAVDIMVKADGVRLFRWAQNAFAKGYYRDAQILGTACATKLEGQPDLTKIIALTAHASLYLGDLGKAEKGYELLVNEHYGSEESKLALFRLGLMRFRGGKWSDASAYFERLISIAAGTDWDYGALYWYWRSQQKLGSAQSVQLAQKLVDKYPLTYYGLRARADLNQGVLKLASASSSTHVKSELWLTENQSQAWERFQLFLKAGWFDEAQMELQELPAPQTPEDRLVRGKLLAGAFDYLRAIKFFHEAWSKKPDLLTLPTVRVAFPSEYENFVEREGRTYGVSSHLIWGLMRQESSFQTKALSPSHAYGLMQLLAGTAQEVSQSLKWKKSPQWPEDLYDPETNIKLGSLYLSRMIRTFNGHIPLALASYNAGIGRVRKWLATRTDLGDVSGRLSSQPEDEVWIDELPWEETSSYVKAVLRNFLIYETLQTGEVQLKSPIWKTAAP